MQKPKTKTKVLIGLGLSVALGAHLLSGVPASTRIGPSSDEKQQTSGWSAIPLDACYLGWQESLANLARLVEPEIPD